MNIREEVHGCDHRENKNHEAGTIFRSLAIRYRDHFGSASRSDPKEELVRIGLNLAMGIGQSVLLSYELGPVSRRNAEGHYIVHRDRKKECAYRTIEWYWTECHGQDRIEQSDVIDVPYKRYPRTFVPPPSVEFTLQELTAGTTAVTVGPFTHSRDDAGQRSLLRHSINLMLEAFGMCQVHGGRDWQVLKSPVRRVNWLVLLPGRYPWPKLKTHMAEVLERMTLGRRAVAERRLQTISGYVPDFTGN